MRLICNVDGIALFEEVRCPTLSAIGGVEPILGGTLSLAATTEHIPLGTDLW